MTLLVNEPIEAGTTPTRTRALDDLLPPTASLAGDDTFLATSAVALAHLARQPASASCQLIVNVRNLPLWQEDALMLEIIPRAAAFLGQAWADDALSFVDVSIASAHLQELTRRVGVRASSAAKTPVIPVILPPWEQHSLGAALAVHRVCRAGRRAVLLSGLSVSRLVRLPVVKAAPALLVSTVDTEGQTRGPEFAAALRKGLCTSAPILLGGPSFSSAYIDSGLSSGALSTPNDPVAVLKACGISLSDI